MSDSLGLQLTSQLGIPQYCLVAACALILYEYAISFANEVQFIWMDTMNSVSYLSIGTRYYAITLCIVILAAIHDSIFTLFHNCKVLWVLVWASLGVMCVASGAILVIRLRSLSQVKETRTTIITGLLLVVQAAFSIYNATISTHSHELGLSNARVCTFESPSWPIATFIALCIASDTTILMMTLFLASQSNHGLPSSPLLQVIRLDGLRYYFFMQVLNIAWLTLELRASDEGLKFTLALPTVLLRSVAINRVVISLRRAKLNSRGHIWDANTDAWIEFDDYFGQDVVRDDITFAAVVNTPTPRSRSSRLSDTFELRSIRHSIHQLSIHDEIQF